MDYLGDEDLVMEQSPNNNNKQENTKKVSN